MKKLLNIFTLYYLIKLHHSYNYDARKIQRKQEKEIKKLIKYAYSFPFYRKRFDEMNLTINDIKTPNDLLKLPTLTKKEYRDFINEEFNKNPHKYKKWFRDGTSGSSGIPLTIYQSTREKSITNAKWLREHTLNGFNPLFSKTFCIISPHRLTKRDSIFQNIGLFRRKSVSYLEDISIIVQEYNNYKPDLFYANKSQIVQMCLFAEKNNIKLFQPKLYVCGAETMDEISKKLITRNLGEKNFYESYGCAELGIIGYQKPGKNDFYYVCHDTNVVNVVDDNMQLADKGKVLITSLYHYGFPMINYELGDYVETFKKNDIMYIKKVIGRQDDWLKFKDGNMLSFHTFYEVLEKRNDIDQFRVIQLTYENIKIQLKAKSNTTNKQLCEREITDELHQLIHYTDINYQFEWLDLIPLDKNGKLRMLISNIS